MQIAAQTNPQSALRLLSDHSKMGELSLRSPGEPRGSRGGAGHGSDIPCAGE